MVQITKTMLAKHRETLSPYVENFGSTACTLPLHELPEYLAKFPSRWPFPRGDLYHWVNLLNRFNTVLEQFCTEYKLDEGPQVVDFGTKLLDVSQQSGQTEGEQSNIDGKLGDEELIVSILDFSRMLLENCGNRSIYASSAHLNHLLNSTSLLLLEKTLLIGAQLAQRYQAALKRMNMPVRNISVGLLSNHYNINLEKVLTLAQPFSKAVSLPVDAQQPASPVTPGTKGKDKTINAGSATVAKESPATVYAGDLLSMAKGGHAYTSPPEGTRSHVSETSWTEWGDVKLTYYPKTIETETTNTSRRPSAASSTTSPVTPSPVRRASNLGPNGTRANRQSSTDDSPATLIRSSTMPTEDTRASIKTIEITGSKLKSAGIHAVLRDSTVGLFQDIKYELLTKLRVANALISSLETRRQALAIRILAITNLAYIHSELVFLEKVLKQDSEEPQRLQLPFQLAELIHPPVEGSAAVPIPLQTIAFSALEALAQHGSKFGDVCKALQTPVNHGILLYVVRNAVAELSSDDSEEKLTEQDQWRAALFALLSTISQISKTGADLVTAGLIQILVEVLNLRTTTAERYHPKILAFLDSIVYSARDAFQTLVTAEGLDAVAKLIVFEVDSASNKSSPVGMPTEYRSASIDYSIPFFQQQTLKWLFKFIHHMMTTAGSFGGNFDRLLRNLIDSPPLLGSLRQIISDPRCFGSTVWTNAVSILNDFINNEPTSFAVIAEAGLSRALLETVTDSTIKLPPKPEESKPEESRADESSAETQTSPAPEDVSSARDGSSSPARPQADQSSNVEDEMPHPPTTEMLEKPRDGIARGIMPTSEAINIIPQAFSAICLNHSGMEMFRASGALGKFFEIFESPEHVKCMEVNRDLPSTLGSSFDELVRHHPALKQSIMLAILDMIVRVGHLCKVEAEKHSIGAKLWTTDSTGVTVMAKESQQTSWDRKGKGLSAANGTDVEMSDAAGPAKLADASDTKESMTPYIGAVATFLSTMFSNPGIRSDFTAKGGIDYVLDLAESSCLPYDFADTSASRTLHAVISLLAEHKAHLVVPSLLKRAQDAVEILAPFAAHTQEKSFFKPFVRPGHGDRQLLPRGTDLAKAFTNVHSLVTSLRLCLQASSFSQRSSQTTFNQMNVSDLYINLVRSLGPLLGGCLRDEISLLKLVPEEWKKNARTRSSGPGGSVVDAVLRLNSQPAPPSEEVQNNGNNGQEATSSNAEALAPNGSTPKLDDTDLDSAGSRNFLILSYLLGKMSQTVRPFFQSLGKALLNKRNSDLYQRQTHMEIAGALAETILAQLMSPFLQPINVEAYAYWYNTLFVLKDMIVEESRQNERPAVTITVVLQAFKVQGGFDCVNRILDTISAEARSTIASQSDTKDHSTEKYMRVEVANLCTTRVLGLYAQLVNGKNVTESAQTQAMVAKQDRDRIGSDRFIPGQFLVELRMVILPTVRRLWESDLVEKAPSSTSEKLIEVIRLIASADGESGSFRRSDSTNPRTKPAQKVFKLHEENVAAVSEPLAGGNEQELARIALYRCNNQVPLALEFYREHRFRFPIPDGEVETIPATALIRPHRSASEGTATPDNHAMEIDPPESADDGPAPSDGEDELIDTSAHDEDEPDNAHKEESSDPLRAKSSTPPESPPHEEPPAKLVTVDDLNDERAAVRENLINKCLDVINAHGEVTFEIADLITTAINKSTDPAALRKDMGETLVIALMSFAGEDDVSTSGNKVAAYAHLLALMLRDRPFYRAAVDELKDNLSTLLSFIQLPSNHTSEEPVPWISNILLIVEMLLTEDATPVKTHWRIPKDDDEKIEEPTLEARDPIVSEDERAQLLEAILDILPRVGKDEPLALSVLRILVILTRSRVAAKVMGEKKNIQRLFVMAKQLAGASTARIQGPLLIVLRHIVEDAETIKQAMRADIRSFFDAPRQQRHPDIQLYLRSLAHAALRDPQLFIEVTNEMVKLSRWSYPSSDGSRNQPSVVLKETNNSTQTPAEKDDSVQPTVQATEDLTIQDVKQSTEETSTAAPDASAKTPKTPTAPEHKLPLIENPDGVIHFLLCELLNYKDVADKDPASAPTANGEKAISPTTTNGDTAMTGTSIPAADPPVADSKPSKSITKQEFKSEDHPIFIYRCFLLHCLTELLSSYNRTKLEFINFKRSAPPQATTPSKPRSSVVNYLLYDLVPTGTLEHAETTATRKKLATSSWAASVLTALLSKTGEHTLHKSRPKSDGDDEPDLQFVRKFVLENVLKSYKDATTSNESLDVKYERMLALADLMSHLMTGKDGMGGGDLISRASEEQLKRLMFEKGYIAALTTSVADVDLNFPGAKRAVKYILRPLKTLTATAVHLCNEGLISEPPAPGEADEIESATSASDLEEGREETPDLFRNSTLGMFEQGDGEESSSEEDDEEMYEGDYGDEMEYEEDMPEDDEDNISDEDEEIEGMEGMGDIEGLPGDNEVDVEVIMEEDDDDDDDDEGSDGDHSHDSGDLDDDDARLEIVDEAGNIQDVGDDDVGEWESEPDEDEEDYEGQAADEEEQARLEGELAPMGDLAHGTIGQLIRAVAGEDGEDMLHQMEADMEAEMEEEVMHHHHHHHDQIDHGAEYAEDMDEGEDEEDEADEEDMDEEEMFFGGYPGDGPVPGFGWAENGPQPMVINHRGHPHRPRNLPFFFPGARDPLAGRSPFQALPAHAVSALSDAQARLEQLGEELDRLRATVGLQANIRTAPDFRSTFRSHRPSSQPSRNENDGTNPLLQRSGSASNRDAPQRAHVMGDWVHAMGPAGPMLDSVLSTRTFGEMANMALNEAIRSLPMTGTIRNGHSYQFHFSGPSGDVPPEFRAIVGGGSNRPTREVRRDTTDPANAASFTPQLTSTRWIEEAKLVFNGATHVEKALILTTAIQALLVPPAIEAEKVVKAAEKERLRKEEEEIQKRQEEERIAREAREAEEKAAREKKEAEEREATERAAAEAAERGEGEATEEQAEAQDTAQPEAMDGVETAAEPSADAEPVQPAADRPRVMTEIRGTPYDITDLGIDADFLAELPEELREEVIMSTVAERRSQAAATGAQPSDIDQEFLDALPDDIREEIVQQERQDRRRREREETRRRAAAEGAPQGPGEMDAASILATVSPALRQQILMEQDDAMIEMLPPDLAAQARAMQREHGGHHGRTGGRRHAPLGLEGREVEIQRPQRRAVVQMLDKPGVATLLRLMFIFQHSGLRNALNSVLQNVCQNRLSRAEVVSTLLTILQDGSADMSAIEHTFAHLTIRAKMPKDQEPKTPQLIKRSLTGTSIDTKALTPTNSEASPLMVVQQCLQTLVYLTQTSPHIPSFFLTEHEISGALKRNLGRKGKSKDNKAAKYAINALLSLLDRDLIMESTSVMESLSLLLDMITTPLQALERKQKEAAEEAKKAEAAASAPEPEPTTTSEANTTGEQPAEGQGEPTGTNTVETSAPPATSTEPGEATTTAAEAPKPEEPTKEPEKKQRTLTPPVIPEHNLKLVINIFVSRECNGKVFQKTISAIKNLSIIPGAKAVFGRELVTKAKTLGEVILKDLEELLPQIQKAITGTQIQGVALVKFSPESSDQRRLLRVLTALDHLFDSKQDKQETPAEEPQDGSSEQIMEKQDLLSTLYNNATFGLIWEKLSACLRTIRQREQILSVATILLPLIESLMVVCKNTTPKEPVRTCKDALMTPVPESRMESLFLTFTEEHRKILNDLVRHQPKLMIGSFKILVKNPKVLEFDNKRSYFNRSIHDRSQAPPNTNSLQLSVRRDQVFHDSFKALYFQTADQMKFGKLSIRFHGEEGVDAGGVTREWFQVLSRQMFDPGYALFIPVSSDRTTFHPNQLSGINEEHLMFFKFIGRIIGKALYEGRVLDCHFSRAVYKRILGKSVSVKDMESFDPDYYKSLIWMLENDITDIITETFSVDNDKFGVVETVDFIPNGRNVPVTDENKHEYVRMMVEWRLTGAVKEQLDEFLKGFHDIIPEKLISIFNEQELELLISGLPDIDVDDWKGNTEYHNYNASSPQIQWFWRAVRSFDKEERAKLLQFVTGTSKVPLNGFKELEGMNGFNRFNLHRDYGNKERLPSSHTCFNQLDLPEYESYESLRTQLLTAITQGSEYFGFA